MGETDVMSGGVFGSWQGVWGARTLGLFVPAARYGHGAGLKG